MKTSNLATRSWRAVLVLVSVGGVTAGLGGAHAQTTSAPAAEAGAPAPGPGAAMSPEMRQRLARMPKSRRDDVQTSSGKIPGPDYSVIFDKQVADIPMRDGITLHTEIYSPKNQTRPLPIIYERTPYGLSPDAQGYSANLRMYPELIAAGYIFALQDIRGRGGSNGRIRDRRPDARQVGAALGRSVD